MCANKFSLEGKNVLVICPENNWGPEIVQGLKAAGCKVFLAGPNKEAMEAMDAAGIYVYDHCTKAQALAMAEAKHRSAPMRYEVVRLLAAAGHCGIAHRSRCAAR